MSLVLFAGLAQAESAVHIHIEKLEGVAFSASNVALELDPKASTLNAKATRLRISRHDFGAVSLNCGRWRNDGNTVECSRAQLRGKRTITGEFRYAAKPESLLLRGAFDANSRFDLQWTRARNAQTARINLNAIDAVLLAPFLPAEYPTPNAGNVNASIDWRSEPREGMRFTGTAAWLGGGFSDAAGLHAGEKISLTMRADAHTEQGQWRFSADSHWRDGEVFWQPLYLRAGHSLKFEGSLSESILQLTKIEADVGRVGRLRGLLEYDVKRKRIQTAALATEQLNAQPLYDEWVKPFLEGQALGNLRVEGRLRVAAMMQEGQLHTGSVQLEALSLEDQGGRFAVFNATGEVPWQRGGVTQANIEWEGAEFAKLPFGATRVGAEIRENGVDIAQLNVPILDGALEIRNLHATAQPVALSFEGKLKPVSLPVLMSAIGGPALQGTFEGNIPRVTYSGGDVRMDGTLTARVFDGDIIVKNLSGTDLFGRVPRFRADAEARRLDLDLVTRAFSFGRITGRIDASVTSLEMMNWQPMWFDAVIKSSEGRYSKRISQRAVQNISSLGGAGAAAAIQRSALRLFETFGYSKLGWSCRLRNGICEMDGIERAPTGYVIVKGGGIPAITVLGYNQQVDWQELVTRLKRVTAPESKPVVEK